MNRYRRPRRYPSYKVNKKYREDPFAFLVLWSLFFSVIFLVFAFRGLIASVFIPKTDVTDEFPSMTDEQMVNNASENNADESPAEN